jgi:hypothetical protein
MFCIKLHKQRQRQQTPLFNGDTSVCNDANSGENRLWQPIATALIL